MHKESCAQLGATFPYLWYYNYMGTKQRKRVNWGPVVPKPEDVLPVHDEVGEHALAEPAAAPEPHNDVRTYVKKRRKSTNKSSKLNAAVATATKRQINEDYLTWQPGSIVFTSKSKKYSKAVFYYDKSSTFKATNNPALSSITQFYHWRDYVGLGQRSLLNVSTFQMKDASPIMYFGVLRIENTVDLRAGRTKHKRVGPFSYMKPVFLHVETNKLFTCNPNCFYQFIDVQNVDETNDDSSAAESEQEDV